jgi:hypothetical protein
MYVETRPVVGFLMPRVSTANHSGPFDQATDLDGSLVSVGTYHYLLGYCFRDSADVTRLVVDLMRQQERPWWFESAYVVFKVHVFVWNSARCEDMHWCCDL